VLILRNLTIGDAYPLIGEEEDDGSGGGDLSASL
jgi:hypothetical protein